MQRSHRRTVTAALPAALLLLGCRSADEIRSPTTDVGQSTESVVAEDRERDPVAALRAHEAAFLARPEHSAERVRVRHLLVSFQGRGVPGVRRSESEAERLAAELFARAAAGEDFAALVAAYSDDSPEGVYTMVAGAGAPPETYGRRQMVRAFGDAGWRLQPGELGVVGFDPAASPFGWHLVRRLE